MSNANEIARQVECRRTVLEILDRAAPYAPPEASVRLSVNAALRPPCGEAEFDETVDWLKSRGFVDQMELGLGAVGWLITESGKAELRR
jgi:hypothetical protein